MVDLLKKGLMLGLGITAMTKEAIEKTVKDLQEKGEINTKEGKKMIEDLLKKSKKQSEEIKKQIEKQVKQVLKTMPVVTKNDLESLHKKIDQLIKKNKKKK